MKANPIKETRLLLNLYPVNSMRLNRLEARHKVEGKTRTWWINAAIREKLDRDHPETNCPDSEYVPVPIELNGPASLKMYEHLNRLLAAFKPAAPLNGVGAIPQEEVTLKAAHDLDGKLNQKWQLLSQEEKDALMEVSDKLTELEVKSGVIEHGPGWKPKSANPMEETPLINVAAPAMEDDADFWGEADEAAYHKIKAKASRR